MRNTALCLFAIAALTSGTSHAQLTAKRIVRLVVPEADTLGVSLAVHADTVLLGTNAPEAYAFQFDGANWWMDRLTVPGTIGHEWFDAVSVDEDVALVGVSNSPHAYVFRFDGTTWFHEATLSDDQGRDRFGDSVAIQGDLAVVASSSGDAQIFRFDGRKWNREARLAPKRPEARFGFANEVVLDGERVLVLKESRIGDTFEGVFAYRFNGARWRLEDTIVLSETETVFIGTIALDGDVALLDADYDDVVHVFRFDGVEWKREAILEPPDLGGPTCSCLPIPSDDRERCTEGGGDTPNFGVSVAIDGDLAMVGANLADEVGVDSGAVYVFRYNRARWKYELKLDGETASYCGMGFGRSVALHGSKALVRTQAGGHGVYVFRIR